MKTSIPFFTFSIILIFFSGGDVCLSTDNDVCIYEDENFKIEQTLEYNIIIKCFNSSAYPYSYTLSKNITVKSKQYKYYLILDNCEFNSAEEVILDVLKKLDISIYSVKFKNVMLTRKKLQGLVNHTLILSNGVNIYSDLLYDIPELKNFYIDQSNVTTIPDKFFLKSTNLSFLVISKTQISIIQRNALIGLFHLNSLILDGNNELNEIDLEAFSDLTSLESLWIENNVNLVSLPAEVFKNLKNLTALMLNGNKFDNLPNNLLANIKNQKLKIFEFCDNKGNFSSLPDGFFRKSNLLKVIDMKNNHFTSIPKDLFNELKHLENINLRDNHLTTLSLTSSLPTSLKSFIASHNNLREIDINFFEGAEFIKLVDLSYNELKKLPSFPKLSVKDVAIDGTPWEETTKLRINLTHNSVEKINLNEMARQYSGKVQLWLARNNLTTIELDIQDKANYGNVTTPSVIYLNDLQLNCDCKLKNFLKYVNYEIKGKLRSYIGISVLESVTCKNPPELENQPVQKIDVKKLYCKQPTCARNCHCNDYPELNTLKMNCSNINLNSIDQTFVKSFKNAQNRHIELNLAKNQLTKIPDLNYKATFFNDVIFLDLSGNKIVEVTPKVLTDKLHTLKLDHNQLRQLSDETVIKLNHSMSNHKSFTLSLHNNPWDCSCRILTFVEFLRSHRDKIINHEKIKCQGSEIEVSHQDLFVLCYLFYLEIAVVLTTLGAILAIMAAFYYKNKKKIKIWLYSKQCCLRFVTEDELDEGKEYDAFVSFSHKDENFVNEKLAERLENGPKPYKLCMHHRDWLAGEWIEYQIIRSVQESRRTIIVLSRNFLESDWAAKEFRIALSQAEKENRIRVIVIKYGDIGNVDDLDDELKRYIKTRTYIEWGDPWFWDKLMYAMPHKYKKTKRKVRNATVKNPPETIPLQNDVTNKTF